MGKDDGGREAIIIEIKGILKTATQRQLKIILELILAMLKD